MEVTDWEAELEKFLNERTIGFDVAMGGWYWHEGDSQVTVLMTNDEFIDFLTILNGVNW